MSDEQQTSGNQDPGKDATNANGSATPDPAAPSAASDDQDPKEDATVAKLSPTPDPATPPAASSDAGPKDDATVANVTVAPVPATPLPAGPNAAQSKQGAHSVYYKEIQIKESKDGDQVSLDFIRSSTPEPPPPGVRDFRRQVEDVFRLVRILFQDDKQRRREFFEQLQAAAQSGLIGPNSNVDVGLDNLQTVKNDIADAYTTVRGRLWKWNFFLLIASLFAAAIAAFAAHQATQLWPWDYGDVKFWAALLMAFVLIPVGALTGLFAEFIFRVNDDIPYDQLKAINPGRWSPVYRAINTIIVGYVLAFILAMDIVKVGVGSVLLNDYVSTRPFLSLTIGFITGFSFPYVRDLIQEVRPDKRQAAAK